MDCNLKDKSKILSSYVRIPVSENPYSGIFYAVVLTSFNLLKKFHLGNIQTSFISVLPIFDVKILNPSDPSPIMINV